MSSVEVKVSIREEKSDISEAKIDVAEPYIRIEDSVYIKKGEVQKIQKLLSQKETELNNIKVDETNKETCTICRNRRENIKVSLIDGGIEKHFPILKKSEIHICEQCRNQISSRLEKAQQEIEEDILYWDSIGINVKRIKNQIEFKDFITNERIETREGLILSIICPKKRNHSHRMTDISNVRRIIDQLKENPKKPEERNYITQKKKEDNDSRTECRFCNRKNNLGVATGFEMPVCDKCKNEIIKKLEKFLEKNKEDVIAHSI